MNLNNTESGLRAPVRIQKHRIARCRKLFLLLPLLVLGIASNVGTVLAASSGNVTTINVANVGPATIYAGAQNVAVLSFTVQVNPAGASEQFRDALVQFIGDSAADIAS